LDRVENGASHAESSLGTFVRSIYTRSKRVDPLCNDSDEVIGVRDFVRLALSELLEIRIPSAGAQQRLAADRRPGGS
jgi:hypothetical protein